MNPSASRAHWIILKFRDELALKNLSLCIRAHLARHEISGVPLQLRWLQKLNELVVIRDESYQALLHLPHFVFQIRDFFFHSSKRFLQSRDTIIELADFVKVLVQLANQLSDGFA